MNRFLARIVRVLRVPCLAAILVASIAAQGVNAGVGVSTGNVAANFQVLTSGPLHESLIIAGMVVAGAVVGAAAGGFIGAMMTRGFEKETTDFYDQALKQGKILVGVEYEGPDQRARLELAERGLAEAGAEPLPLRKG